MLYGPRGVSPAAVRPSAPSPISTCARRSFCLSSRPVVWTRLTAAGFRLGSFALRFNCLANGSLITVEGKLHLHWPPWMELAPQAER
jgi:hypothetical protein